MSKRAWILSIRSIASQSHYSGTRFSLISLSSRHTNRSSHKASVLIHRRFSYAAQRSDFSPEPNGQHPHHDPSGHFPQSPYGFEARSHGSTQPSSYKHYGENVGDAHHWNSNGFYREGPSQKQEDGVIAGRSQVLHRHPNWNGGRTCGELYQAPNGHYRDNMVDGFQRTSEYNRLNPRGEPPTTMQGFHGQMAAGFQQRPNESHADRAIDFQQSSTSFQAKPSWFNAGTSNSSSLGSTKFDEEQPTVDPRESAESGGYRGTIDELDNFIKEGKVKESVEVLGLLEKTGLVLDRSRYLCLLQSCGEPNLLKEARVVHHHVSRAMTHEDIVLHNKVLGMYSNCGSMADAYRLFEMMPRRNLTSWDTMIIGLANNDLGEEAINLFTQFKETGLRPDGQIFSTIFSVCGVLGAVDEGLLHFESMQKDFDIAPCMGHYVGIVDMLGKNGYLDEALEFIEKMPTEPSVDVWEILMNLSRLNGDVELGDRCAEIVEHMDPSRMKEHVKRGLLYIDNLELAKEQEKRKSNILEAKSRLQEYRAGDRSHPGFVKFFEQVRGLMPQMREAGYVPDTRFVLHDVEQESKEDALLYHSERLAAAHGFMTSPARSQILITKNLRTCGDCHRALMIISKLVGRRLVVRDIKRFHHFENGACSCNEFY